MSDSSLEPKSRRNTRKLHKNPRSVKSMTIVLAAVGIVAFLFRLIPLLTSGTLGGFRGYDDGVHYASGVNLLAGLLPYRDFVLVHPPGIALLMVPFAFIGQLFSDTAGIGAARVFFAMIGALNAVLIGVLLRRWGYVAVLAGAFLYSVSPVATIAERSIMLSPLLTVCTLAAMLSSSRNGTEPSKGKIGLAAVFLALAMCFKLWAIVPIAVVVAMVGLRYGPRILARFLLVGTLVCCVVMGPFFIAAPVAMFNNVIVAQLVRTDGAVKDLVYRLNDFVGVPLPQTMLFAVAIGGVVVVLAAAAIGLRYSFRPVKWADEFWWAVLASATVATLLIAMSFFDHYPNFSAAYLALCLGATLGFFVQKLALGRVPIVRGVVLALVAVCLVPVGIRGFILEPKPLPNVNEAELAAETAPFSCVFTPYAYLGIISDSLSRSVDHGCGSVVDVYGTRMVEGLESAAFSPISSGELQIEQLRVSDAAVVGNPQEYYGMSPAAIDELTKNFVLEATQGNFQVWVRR
ncbi:hypothetical protein AAGW05_00725 [Arthrobacter sp. LAPM80]|uniref:ArnT family glycosyltransferase n=1 Tax=Arthrobacter sp. LAPM80 TaxID=3141788 RepID=UPI00398B3A90